MDRIGVRELRQNLSVYLRRVANGEALTVTEHGRPVAVLAPLPADEHPLAGLFAAAKATRAHGTIADLPRPRPAAGPTLSEVLQDIRDEDDR